MSRDPQIQCAQYVWVIALTLATAAVGAYVATRP